jgi:short-subunit dehydrogenase
MSGVELVGRWVVVTGATSGLGEAMARQLALEHGAKVVLVGRREDRLRALEAELRSAGREAVSLTLDLSAPDAPERLWEEANRGREVHALVLDAATYWFGEFNQMPEDEVAQMLAVNAVTPVRVVRRLLPELDARGSGGILLIASTGGLMPAPFQAVYAGTKALICNFALSLHHERGEDAAVPVCLCCPGGMPTAMLTGSAAAARVLRHPWLRWMMMEPEEVARQALRAFVAGEALCIPGQMNRAMDRFTRLLPRGVAGRGAARVYRS